MSPRLCTALASAPFPLRSPAPRRCAVLSTVGAPLPRSSCVRPSAAPRPVLRSVKRAYALPRFAAYHARPVCAHQHPLVSVDPRSAQCLRLRGRLLFCPARCAALLCRGGCCRLFPRHCRLLLCFLRGEKRPLPAVVCDRHNVSESSTASAQSAMSKHA